MIKILEDSHCSYASFELLKDNPEFICLTSLRNNNGQPFEASSLGRSAGITGSRTARIMQVHSDKIIEIHSRCDLSPPAPEADGIIIMEPGLFGIVSTADCVPVVLVNAGARAAAIVHAGWKGTCAGITGKAAERLLTLTSGKPDDIRVFAGPCIHSCCYEVGTEVVTAFEKAGLNLEQIMTGRNLDLVRANLLQALDLGITDISSSGFCTACDNDLFYSYRRENTPHRVHTIAGFIPQGGRKHPCFPDTLKIHKIDPLMQKGTDRCRCRLIV